MEKRRHQRRHRKHSSPGHEAKTLAASSVRPSGFEIVWRAAKFAAIRT